MFFFFFFTASCQSDTEEAGDPDLALTSEQRSSRYIGNRQRAAIDRLLLPGNKMTFSPRPVERNPSPSQEQIISMRRPGCCGRPSGMYRGYAASTFQRVAQQADGNVCIVSDADSPHDPNLLAVVHFLSGRSAPLVHFARFVSFRSSC